MESGSPAADPGVCGNFTAISTTTVAQLAGCSGKDDSTVLTCLRSLPMTTLLDAVLQYENITANATAQDIFFPVVDGDFIPDAPSALLRTGRFHKDVSVIAGWTYNDGSLFAPPQLNSSEDVAGYIEAMWPYLNSTTVSTLLSLFPLKSFVPTAQFFNASPYYFQAAQIWREINFACPAIDAAHRVAQYGSPSYLYDFNTTVYAAEFAAANASYLGVPHTSDIPFVFDISSPYISAANNVTELHVSGSWVHFATTGNPSGGADTLRDWEVAYNKTEAALSTQSVREISVRVIGGPNAGQHHLTLGAKDGIEPQLLKRCAFINTESFYEQEQT